MIPENKFGCSINSNCNRTLNDVDNDVVYAFLNGYFENKEIANYLSEYKKITSSSVRYNMQKLLIIFNTNSRSELFRQLLNSKFATMIITEYIKTTTTIK